MIDLVRLLLAVQRQLRGDHPLSCRCYCCAKPAAQRLVAHVRSTSQYVAGRRRDGSAFCEMSNKFLNDAALGIFGAVDFTFTSLR